MIKPLKMPVIVKKTNKSGYKFHVFDAYGVEGYIYKETSI